MKNAISLKVGRPRDILGGGEKSIKQRLIFNCLVIGGSGSGKTAFLDSFVSAPGQQQHNEEQPVERDNN
jgi:septin family protein